MKKITLLAILILALLPIGIKAQPPIQGVAGAGAEFRDCGTFSFFVGGDINVYTDTARGFKSYTRVTGRFAKYSQDTEDEGVALWQMIEQDFTSWLYLGTGLGYIRNFKPGPDDVATGLKLEAGWAPIKRAALILGVDYLLEAGKDDQDIVFIYVGINLR